VDVEAVPSGLQGHQGPARAGYRGVVEVITKDDQGLLNDLGVWCPATGHEFLRVRVQPGEGQARVLVRKGSRCATPGR
jgi:hypothetical protein